MVCAEHVNNFKAYELHVNDTNMLQTFPADGRIDPITQLNSRIDLVTLIMGDRSDLTTLNDE